MNARSVCAVVVLMLTVAAQSDTVTLVTIGDNRIGKGDPDVNWGSLFSISVYNDGLLNVQRPVIQFDPNAIPAGSVIQSATLRLTRRDLSYTNNGLPTWVYRITTPWTEFNSTWNSPWSSPGGDFVGKSGSPYATNTQPPGDVTIDFNVKDLVQEWANGTYPNYGFFLMAPTGNGMHFHSKEGSVSYAPQLIVTYGRYFVSLIQGIGDTYPSIRNRGSNSTVIPEIRTQRFRVRVTDVAARPVQGKTVRFSQRADYNVSGHVHGSPDAGWGWFNPTFPPAILKDHAGVALDFKGILTTTPGFNPVQNYIETTTDAQGYAEVFWSAPEVSGDIYVVPSVEQQINNPTEQRIQVRHLGFVPLPKEGPSDSYKLIGWEGNPGQNHPGDATNPGAHWGTPAMVNSLIMASNAFLDGFRGRQEGDTTLKGYINQLKTYLNAPSFRAKYGTQFNSYMTSGWCTQAWHPMYVNDMCLPYGGIFDIWANWRPPHATHRNGNQVDVRVNKYMAAMPSMSGTTYVNLATNPSGLLLVSQAVKEPAFEASVLEPADKAWLVNKSQQINQRRAVLLIQALSWAGISYIINDEPTNIHLHGQRP